MSTGERMDLNFLFGKDDSELQNEWSALKQAESKINLYNTISTSKDILVTNIASIYNRIAHLSHSTSQAVQNKALKDLRTLSASIEKNPELLNALLSKITDKHYFGRRSEIIGTKRASIRKTEATEASDKLKFDAFIQDLNTLKQTNFKKEFKTKALISNYCENVLTPGNIKSKIEELRSKIPGIGEMIDRHYPELATTRKPSSGKKHT
jgi:hypothetical protein